jgi:hypothetical protein
VPPRQGAGRNTPKLVKEGIVLTAEQAYVLRGASIDACKMIIETATSLATDDSAGDTPDCIKNLTLARLDIWARTVVKAVLDYEDLDIFTQQSSPFF